MEKPMHHRISVVPGSLTAMLDRRPGRSRDDRFLVVVDVAVEASCIVALVAALPQGINPSIKLLRISVAAEPIPPDGPIVVRTLRYEEAPPGADYREVWLGEGDAAISAKVSITM